MKHLIKDSEDEGSASAAVADLCSLPFSLPVGLRPRGTRLVLSLPRDLMKGDDGGSSVVSHWNRPVGCDG